MPRDRCPTFAIHLDGTLNMLQNLLDIEGLRPQDDTDATGSTRAPLLLHPALVSSKAPEIPITIPRHTSI